MATRNSQTLMQTGDDTFDFLFKIVLIGDCSVGKTKIVQRFKTGNYVESHENTIGVDFSMKTITVDGKKVKNRTRVTLKRPDPFSISRLNNFTWVRTENVTTQTSPVLIHSGPFFKMNSTDDPDLLESRR